MKNPNDLYSAVESGDIESVKVLLARGAEVNVKNFASETPLHEATERGKIEVVEVLLAKGAEVNKDVMSPMLQRQLRTRRNHVLSVFSSLRSGMMNEKEAARDFEEAKDFIDIYSSFFGWQIEKYGFGTEHPYSIFASYLLRSAKILMGEDWVEYHSV